MSNLVLSYTNWLRVCRILKWILSLSIVFAFLLLSMMPLKNSDILDFVWLMLYRARLTFISSLTLLSFIETSILELESFLCISIFCALRQDLLRSGYLYSSIIGNYLTVGVSSRMYPILLTAFSSTFTMFDYLFSFFS